MATLKAGQARLTEKTKRPINAALAAIGKTFHDGIPMDRINEALALGGMHVEECLFCGRQGRATLELTSAAGNRVVNSVLAMTWYKMETTGRYEVVAYLS